MLHIKSSAVLQHKRLATVASVMLDLDKSMISSIPDRRFAFLRAEFVVD